MKSLYFPTKEEPEIVINKPDDNWVCVKCVQNK